MTDDLIARLRATVPSVYDCKDAADALKAQARRIAKLEKMIAVHRLAVDVDALKARIAELEVPLCIGRRTIGIMAEEGMWQSEDGRAVVAADELFRQDPYARIAELEAENEELKKAISKPWMGSARAAYLGDKE
jgi:hypothetical protein